MTDWKAPKVCKQCGKQYVPRSNENRMLYARRRYCSAPCSHLAKSIPAEERFWRHVDKTESCWLWTASKRGGYGQFHAQTGAPSYAHRFSYELLVGPIPPGLELDHLCRNPGCVNPSHLEPVTHEENWWRGAARSRINAEKDECIHGHLFDAKNTRVSKEGWRYCRECDRLAAARYRANAKATKGVQDVA